MPYNREIWQLCERCMILQMEQVGDGQSHFPRMDGRGILAALPKIAVQLTRAEALGKASFVLAIIPHY